jgi:hypothetical protein
MESHNIPDLDLYAFTDPAGGKSKAAAAKHKKIRALQAAIVVAVDSLQRIFVLYSWSGRLPPSAYLDKLITICDNYNPKLFGIEANAMQSLFADLVHTEARRRLGAHKNKFLEVNQPTKIDKFFRIRTTLEPVINEGRLFVPENMTELLADLRGFPTIQHIDRIDCLASAVALIPQRPLPQKSKDEADALASYLRNTGVSSHEIEKRIKELYG